jgi:hypothetical protein
MTLRRSWKKAALLVLSGGLLVQVGSCATALGPLAYSLGESVLLTMLFGNAF